MRSADRYWYAEGSPPLHLRLLAALFGGLAALRRRAYRRGWFRTRRPDCPVIVVGNITAGGTGKTPLVIWLAGLLQDHGYRPGIVSRGYGGRPGPGVRLVASDTDPALAGDEPVLIARRTGLPVAVHPARPRAAAYLVDSLGVNVVIADDGLQHYALGRDIEICLLDGERRLGNGYLQPAGPLREGPWRLTTVDHVVVNGEARPGQAEMRLAMDTARSLETGEQLPLERFAGRRVHAAAGIGNPERFFSQLEEHGLEVERHPFPDHHAFGPGELDFADGRPVFITEKDAVRLGASVPRRTWCVPVTALLPGEFRDEVLASVKALSRAGAEDSA